MPTTTERYKIEQILINGDGHFYERAEYQVWDTEGHWNHHKDCPGVTYVATTHTRMAAEALITRLEERAEPVAEPERAPYSPFDRNDPRNHLTAADLAYFKPERAPERVLLVFVSGKPGNLYDEGEPSGFYETDDPAKAEMYGSRLAGRKTRYPVIDLDVPHKLEASRTTGHGHLYLDVEMSWRKEKRILRALKKAGVVTPGYYNMCKRARQSFVRIPGKKG